MNKFLHLMKKAQKLHQRACEAYWKAQAAWEREYRASLKRRKK